jgi:glutaredoxin
MNITVYSKPACQFCDKAKALLTQLHYEYTEKVVTKDIGGFNELREYFVDKGKINYKGELL